MGPAWLRVTSMYFQILRAMNMRGEVAERGTCVKRSHALHEGPSQFARLGALLQRSSIRRKLDALMGTVLVALGSRLATEQR